MDDEKKELFEKNRVFAEFLMQSPEKHYPEIIDLIFSFIGFQKIEREINDIEFILIEKLSENEESDLHDDNILFLHDPQTKQLSMFFLLDDHERANLLKKK